MTDRHRDRGGRRLTASVTDLDVVRQRAIVIGVVAKSADIGAAEDSLAELALLVDTAGSDPVEVDLQRRDKLDPATLIGKGKAEELAAAIKALDIDVAVFDHELSPSQQRNLQNALKVDVVDREAVILDIFAQHATSRAGMLQVELALLQYRLPRLRGKGTEMSRLGGRHFAGGGLGTRGPGETKLETDRRRITDRIRALEQELKHLQTIRATQRKARTRSSVPEIAIVGYTNAGKSTLLNQMTGAGVLVEDRLFSTLDATVRRYELPGGQEVLLADTVGFVQRLPHHLVSAFKSTLDEAAHADLLLHIVDGSSPVAEEQIAAVGEVLADIGAGEIPELLVLNKSDVAEPETFSRLRLLHPDAVPISAKTGAGIDGLVDAVTKKLAESTTEVDLYVPYGRGDIVAALHRRGEVMSEDHDDSGTHMRVRLPRETVSEFDDLRPQSPA